LFDLSGEIPFEYQWIFIASAVIPVPVAVWILYSHTLGIVASISSLILFVLITRILGLPILKWDIKLGLSERGETVGGILLIIHAFISCFLILKLALSLKIYWTALLLMGVMPIYAAMILVTFVTLCEAIRLLTQQHFMPKDEDSLNIGFAFTLSFFITAIALFFGFVCSPGAYIPKTIQMFLVNVLCDGITLVLTFVILQGAIDRVIGDESSEQQKIKRKYPIPAAIVIDIVAAAFLAYLSLYLGLVGSDNALSITETVNVLIGRAPSGGTGELGPYFWAMHTTFIPTAIYLTVIMLAYIGKLIILPVFHVLKKGKELEKPHDLSAAVFAFVAVVFLALAGLLNRITPE
jgi:hypothetical protein